MNPFKKQYIYIYISSYYLAIYLVICLYVSDDVSGLNNTGDTLKTGHFTKQSLQSMLNRMGVKPTDSGLDSKNVAAVMVTAA